MKDLGTFLRPLVTSFVAELGYETAPNISDETYWGALHRQATNTGVPYPEGSHSYKCLRVGGTYAIACFPNHPLDVQVYVGIYTWLVVIIDDVACKSSAEFEHYWDPVVANFIVASSLDFLNACVLEARPEFRHLAPTKGGQSFPWYLRFKNGLPDTYAYFTFPKALYPDISYFLEAIPDLSMYICLANDVLSFYKEEKAEEKNNYLHHRARYESKDVRTVLEDVIKQVLEGVHRTRVVVQGRAPYEQALNSHILGYVGFHMLNDRYRLKEVGLGEEEGTK
ncbi:terpenoid synthase [Hypoxylon crocopeplum]|nr:terpenoid synthase [Hypoxylon crocopeplum]